VKISSKDQKAIDHVVELAIFKPTPEQRKLKAEFWLAYSDGPKGDVSKLTASAVVSITDSSAVESWWSDPDFKSWFLKEKSFEYQVEYLAGEALEIIHEIMISADKAGDRLSAAKLAVEMAGKLKPKTDKTVFADQAIASMNQAELGAFIARLSPATKEPS